MALNARNTGIPVLERKLADLYRLVREMTGLDSRVKSLERARLVQGGRVNVEGELFINWKFVQETVSTVEKGRMYVWIEGGFDKVSAVEASTAQYKNFDGTLVWNELTLLTDNPSEYPNGYYRAEITLSEQQRSSYISGRALNALGQVLWQEGWSFDADRSPDLVDPSLAWGAYEVGSDTYPLYLSTSTDEDALSIEYGVQTSEISDITDDGEYTDALTSTKRVEAELIADVTPGDTVWVVVRARENANGTGQKTIEDKIFYKPMTAPEAPYEFDVDDIPDGSLVGSMLVRAAQKYSTNLRFYPHASLGYKTLVWESAGGGTAYIQFTDGTRHTITQTSKDLSTVDGGGTPTRVYVYYDPDVSTSAIQFSTTFEDVLETNFAQTRSSPNRIWIGVAERNTDTNEYLFFVTNTGDLIISAPIIYAAYLQTLAAKTGDLEVTGTLEMGASGEITNTNGDFTTDNTGYNVQALAAIGGAYSGPRGYKIFEGGTRRFVLWHSTLENKTYLDCDEGLELVADDVSVGDIPTAQGNFTVARSEIFMLATDLGGSGDIEIQSIGGIIELNGEVRIEDGDLHLRSTTNPSTPASGSVAIYHHNFASGADHMGFENSGGTKFLFPHIDTLESSPVLDIPIDNADLYDDTIPGTQSPTEKYLHIQDREGNNYYIRLYQP